MKKIFYCLCAASAMLFTACSDEAVNAPVEGESLVTITAQLPADLGTRAFGDGTTAKNLTYAVYEEGQQTPLIVNDELTFSGLTATVNLRLANGKSYDLVFWADAAGSPYTFDADAQTVNINYNGVTSNLEKLDAFFAHEDALHVTGTINKTIELRRPFAQLNIGATDYAAATTAAFTTASSAVKVKHVANALNIHTGVATGNETITFDDAAVPANTERFPVEGIDADYLAMNYLLVNADKQLVDVEFTATSENSEKITRSYANVPVQRNFRTNIYGNILTEDANFNIVIVPGFKTPDYGPVEVATAADLATAVTTGIPIKLTADVALTSTLTIPAGKEVTIDLNGKTLKTTPESAVSVEDGSVLNLSNGKVSSTTQGEAYSSICVGNTGKVTVDNVQFVSNGSLFLVADDSDVTIKNSSLKAQAYCVGTNASTSTQNPTILLENSTFESETPVLVNIPCSLTLNGCTLNGRWQGLMVRGGTAVVKNSHINVNYAAADAATMATKYASRNWGSGNNVPVAAATFGNRTTNAYQYATNVTVENSNFNVQGDNASLFPAVYIYANSGNGIGVTFNYDAVTTFTGGSKEIAVGSTNVTINGTAATVTE